MPVKSIYDFSATAIGGEKVSFNVFRDKLLLVVNTASECGFTPQYRGLEALYRTYKNEGLVILGFPCNQFGNQEPGSEEDIVKGCVSDYGVTFPMFSKVNVNGPDAHPLFKYLKRALPGGLLGNRIKWNFTKFLIDARGTPVKRFGTTTTPEKIGRYLQENRLLGDM
jgi:glutathione peroxidase